LPFFNQIFVAHSLREKRPFKRNIKPLIVSACEINKFKLLRTSASKCSHSSFFLTKTAIKVALKARLE